MALGPGVCPFAFAGRLPHWFLLLDASVGHQTRPTCSRHQISSCRGEWSITYHARQNIGAKSARQYKPMMRPRCRRWCVRTCAGGARGGTWAKSKSRSSHVIAAFLCLFSSLPLSPASRARSRSCLPLDHVCGHAGDDARQSHGRVSNTGRLYTIPRTSGRAAPHL
jgi:hypothetical protein